MFDLCVLRYSVFVSLKFLFIFERMSNEIDFYANKL